MLESSFDDYGDKVSRAVAYMRGGWKGEALEQSRREMPQLPRTGLESGLMPGYRYDIRLKISRNISRPDHLSVSIIPRMGEALEQSRHEMPQLPRTGLESGLMPGYRCGTGMTASRRDT
jgi:hypothetical protein